MPGEFVIEPEEFDAPVFTGPNNKYMVFSLITDKELDSYMTAHMGTVTMPFYMNEAQTAVKDIEFEPTVVILYRDDEPVDFSTLESHADFPGEVAGPFDTNDTNIFYAVRSYQAGDPRQNLRADDWKYYGSENVTSSMPSSESTLGSLNKDVNPSVTPSGEYRDKEL